MRETASRKVPIEVRFLIHENVFLWMERVHLQVRFNEVKAGRSRSLTGMLLRKLTAMVRYVVIASISLVTAANDLG